MNPRFTKVLVSISAGLALLGAANFAQASALTQTQISAIISLLQSFGADQSVINNVETALGGTPSQGSCVTITRNLTIGSDDGGLGGEVSYLQSYLIGKGYLPADDYTGYYGFLTAQAIGKLQLSLGIVSSSADLGYGNMGPKTRAAISCGDRLPQPLSANLTSGPAPLTVTFFDGDASLSNIDFGDGSSLPLACAPTPNCPTNHTYQNAGTYTVTFEDYQRNVLKTLAITVTNNSTQPYATIDPSSLMQTTSSFSVSGIASKVTGLPNGLGGGTTAEVETVLLSKPYSGGTDWGSIENYLKAAGIETKEGIQMPSSTVTSDGNHLYLSNGTISNGKFSVNFENIPNGTYLVLVYGLDSAMQTQLVANNTLTIHAASQPVAAIDQNSLISATTSPVLTGTVRNVTGSYLDISVQGLGLLRRNFVPISNGFWTYKVTDLVPGTYTVKVFTGNENILTTGTLTVTQ